MEAAAYLRKSRMEEGMDTDEVLARHRTALTSFAAKNKIHIIETYCEVVSGESLYARPEMLRLLEDVEGGKYDAVLVMDLDRLSRGRMKDQGIILDAFRDTDTLIITPEKTYNLADDLDDEMAEFKTFMSRREYKIINKRLRRGLHQSVQAGCYVANAPYGYRRITVDKRPTLEIVEDEAKFVHMIYDLYVSGHGCVSIARHINALGARPRRCDSFNRSTVALILRNPTYTGKVVWGQKRHIRKGAKGNPKTIITTQPKDKWTIVDGLHPAIIDKEQYDLAQKIMDGRYLPSKNDGTRTSPLAGLVKCANCGHKMQRMGMNGGKKDKNIPYLLCSTPGCCASAKFEYVEGAIIDHLKQVLADLTVDKATAPASKDTSALEETLVTIRKNQTSAAGQKARLYELLEIGEYDIPTFRERMEAVKAKIAELDKLEADTLRDIDKVQRTDPIALAKKIEAVLDAYEDSDPANRNALLHSVINVIWYRKDKKTKPMDFDLSYDLKPF